MNTIGRVQVGRADGRWQRVVAAGLVACSAAACQGGDAEMVRRPVESDPVGPATELVSYRSAGYGRALAVASDGAAGIVVTTAGVYAQLAGDTEPARLGAFAAPVGQVDAALAPDGQSAAVALGNPASVRFYDLAASATEHTVEIPGGQVATVEFAADGTLVAQGPTTLVTWPDGTGGAPAQLADGAAHLGTAALLPDGRIVVPVLGTRDLLIGPLAGPLERRPLEGLDEGTLADARSTPAGTLAVSVEFGADLLVVDPNAPGVVGRLATGVRTDPWAWALTDTLVAVAGPQTAQVYALDGTPAGTLVVPPRDPAAGPSRVTRVAASPTGFVTLSDDGTLAVWDEHDLTAPAATTVTLADPVSFDVQGATIHSVGPNGEIAVWDAADASPVVAADRFAAGRFTGVAVGGEGRVAVASSAGRAFLYDRDLHQVGSVDQASRAIGDVAFVPGTADLVTALAARVATNAYDDTVTRWNGDSLEPVFEINGAATEVPGCAFFYNRLRFSADGTLLAVIKHTFEVELVDPATGSSVHTFAPHASTVLDAAFTADGRLVTSGDDARVRVWNVGDGSLQVEYSAPIGGYYSLTPLDDGTMVATDIDGTVSIVDIATGEPVAVLPTTTFRDGRPALSPSGATLAIPTTERAVELWSTATRQRSLVLDGPNAPVSDVTFASDTDIVGVAQDGTLHAWQLGAG